MDKNTVTGLILMAVVLFGFTWWSQPSQEEIAAYNKQQDSLRFYEQLAREKAEAQSLEAQALAELQRLQQDQDTTNVFHVSRKTQNEIITIQNDLVCIDINTRGGMPQRAEMKQYGSYNDRSQNVVLFHPEDVSFCLNLDGKNENIYTRDLTFLPIITTDTTVVLHAATNDKTGYIELAYTLHPHSYMIDLAIKAKGLQNLFPAQTRTIGIEWSMHARQQEKGYDFENRYASVTYKEKDRGSDYLNETSDKEEQIDEALDWIAFKNQFFSCVMIAHQDFTDSYLKSTLEKNKKSGYLKQYEATMNTMFDPSGMHATELQFYFGPNDFHLLQAHNKLCTSGKDLELENLVYLGWPLFRWINRWIILNLFDFLRGWGLHMGIVLLLITLIMKLLVYPATKKSFMASARMRVLKPKVDEINAKYPNQEDALKKQQEVMSLYSQYGVSPMGGCLPMLIQMPVWIALFNFVPNAIQLRGESFLWADDLSAYDELLRWETDLWLIGDHLSIFCLLFCATNIINTIISMRQQQNAAMNAEQEQSMKMMRWMMYLMPVIFFFMFNNYSSGLNYYYFLSGLTSILLMWYLRRSTNDDKLLSELEQRYRERKAKGQGQTSGAFGNLSSMAQRLQELQRLQEEQRKNKK